MKKIFAIFSIVLILSASFFIPAFALTQYRVSMYDVSGDDFVGVQFKADNDSTWSPSLITYDTYIGNFDFSLECKITVQDELNYTGCFLLISTSEAGENIAQNLVNINQDAYGNIYVPNGVPFQLNLTVYPPTTYYFSCIRVNYADYISAQDGYLRGYNDGRAYGYQQAYNDLYQPTLDELNALKAAISDQTGGLDLDAYVAQRVDAARSAAIRDSEMVPNLLESVFNSVGRIFGQFLSLEIFGIKVFAIVLVLALIPLALMLIKLFMAHGG